MEILKVENLSKVYGTGEARVVALDKVSFSVEKGEFVAIVGASGSGKSTLLHLLGGVDRPTSGKVYVDGEDIYELSDDALAIFRRRQVGFIYQLSRASSMWQRYWPSTEDTWYNSVNLDPSFGSMPALRFIFRFCAD